MYIKLFINIYNRGKMNNTSIEVVFCNESNLQRLMTISDVRREYFAVASHIRKKFELFCSDPSCLQPNGKRTKYSAVNAYEPNFDPETNISRKPHFRIYRNQEHHESCLWNEFTSPKM